MRFYLATALLIAFSLYEEASAFVPSHGRALFGRCDACLDMTKKKKNSSKKKKTGASHSKKKPLAQAQISDPSVAEPKKKTLTAADIINRARQASGMPEMEEAPKLFEDDLLDDMRQSLLMLEKRVKEGAGALSVEEVEDFEVRMKRVVDEMNEKLGVAPAPAPAKPEFARTAGYGITDKSNDEAPAYDGKAGFGVARGTRNTYVIPGMEEMSPEEYRKALQESVSNRQTRRKGSRSGVVGNRAALQYLDQLGAGGASSNWKANDDDEDSANDHHL